MLRYSFVFKFTFKIEYIISVYESGNRTSLSRFLITELVFYDCLARNLNCAYILFVGVKFHTKP